MIFVEYIYIYILYIYMYIPHWTGGSYHVISDDGVLDSHMLHPVLTDEDGSFRAC